MESRKDVAYVCRQTERIRADLVTYGPDGAAPLERLLSALRDGEEITAPLDALHEALLAAGDAVGIYGHTRGLTPHGVTPTMPDERVLLCPTDQCSRFEWPDGADALRCPISSRPLRREHL
ncbi:hypothetical protein ABZ858_30175 [Streptomyces sp. NPDC047017]|uniref:hypothetical protein n=1 Tax=Streptomyces sp. NPDC047017 TaxID=3155024 RepID=UPI0033DCB298